MDRRMKQIKVDAKPKGLEMEIDRQQFALALKTWRLRAGFTQRELAERWNTSRYTILRAERAHSIGWMSAYRLFAKLAKELEAESHEVYDCNRH